MPEKPHENKAKGLEESIRSDASVSGNLLGKPGDESSSILVNSVPADIHGGANANTVFGKLDKMDKAEDPAAHSMGHADSSSSVCEHSKKLRRVHNPYGHSDHASSMKSSKESQGGGRKIELDKVSDDENTGAGQSSSFGSKGWQHQSRFFTTNKEPTEDSYDNDEFDDFSLSATASKLDKSIDNKGSSVGSQRQQIMGGRGGKRKASQVVTTKDATPIKEEAFEEDSEDANEESRGSRGGLGSHRKPAPPAIQKLPSKLNERRGSVENSQRKSGSRGSFDAGSGGFDRDSKGEGEIAEDMLRVEEQSKS